MRILISNDDGIHSPALRALAEMASEHGEVMVAAPASEQSATSHSISIYAPLRAHQSNAVYTSQGVLPAYGIDGTPADSVALGLHLFENIDLVLSGINMGTNVGLGIMHSGTVSAARQAVAMGVAGIAFSCGANELEQDFLHFAPYVSHAIHAQAQYGIRLLNVNFPAVRQANSSQVGAVSTRINPKAIHWTHMSTEKYERRITADTDSSGQKVYWSKYVGVNEPEVGSDRWAIANNYVSFTPMTLQGADMDILKYVPSLTSK